MSDYLTVIAFDFGTRQIGVAVGQTLTATARPLAVLKARDGIPDWGKISSLLKEWQPDKLLVGLPLNMDGSRSEFCARTEKFARRLHGRYGLPVEMMDERLSTFEAKQRQPQHTSYRENPIDDSAACLILEGWLRDTGTGQPLNG